MKQKKKSILKNYVLILFLISSVLIISFFSNRLLINQLFMNQAYESSEIIFNQARSSLQLFEEDIDALYTGLVSSDYISQFLETDRLEERAALYKKIEELLGSNMRISRNLEGIALYDKSNKLVANSGKIFIEQPQDMILQGMVTYTGLLGEKNKGLKQYFGVGMPVYSEIHAGKYTQLGSVFLIFNTENLKNILKKSLLNEESSVALMDKDGSFITIAGSQPAAYEEKNVEKTNIVNRYSMKKSGWLLLSEIPKNSLISDVSGIRTINTITYLLVFAAFLTVCYLVYRQVLRPVRRQMQFMSEYPKRTGERIEILERNEMGQLAEKMNEMLDRIEELNQEKLEGEKRYLNLQYQKKQTEFIAYKSQITPHFMYNTFECIRGMALYCGQKDIAELTKALSDLFRYNVKGNEIVTLKEAFYNLEKYAIIIYYRFMGKIQIKTELPEEYEEVVIPKMLLQPLVENAVLHGLEPQIEEGCVWIKAGKAETENTIEISVSDDGVGISEEILCNVKEKMKRYDEEEVVATEEKGIGILNVYWRMRLFYGTNANLSFSEGYEKGTEILLRIPQDKKEMSDQ